MPDSNTIELPLASVNGADAVKRRGLERTATQRSILIRGNEFDRTVLLYFTIFPHVSQTNATIYWESCQRFVYRILSSCHGYVKRPLMNVVSYSNLTRVVGSPLSYTPHFLLSLNVILPAASLESRVTITKEKTLPSDSTAAADACGKQYHRDPGEERAHEHHPHGVPEID